MITGATTKINHSQRCSDAGNSIGLRIASRDFPFFLVKQNQPTIKFYRKPPNTSNISLPVVP